MEDIKFIKQSKIMDLLEGIYMEVNEQWLPIISETINWIREKMKPTKKELELKITDLEEQVKILSYGNQSLKKDIEQIMSIIISQLKSDGQYLINADTIVYIVENSGQMHIAKDDSIKNISCDNDKNFIDSIFDNMDEEIKQCRLMRPSERGDVK